MKIALIGGTGNVGSRILAESLQRNHRVTAIVRHVDKLITHPNLTALSGDILDTAALGKALSGHEIVISAYNPARGTPDYTAACLKGYESIISATKAAHVKRFLMIGGAGSLEVAPGVQVLQTPNFPPEYKVEAEAFAQVLTRIRQETALDWTYLSPSAILAPGDRTGNYRLGRDNLLIGADGQSRISMEDLAVAVVDEVEQNKHVRQRFTVGY